MDNIQDRDRAAVVNKYLKMLDKEFKDRRIFRDSEKEICMLKALLYKILILSYTPVDRISLTDQKFKIELYQPADPQKDLMQDYILELLCGDNKERVKIEEAYPVKRLYLIRYLPIAVGYMLQKGISNMDTEGKSYLHILRFMAYWVFELDMYLPAETRKLCENELLTQSYNEVMNNGNSEEVVERKAIIAAVIHEYYMMLKKYFKQYLYGKNEDVHKECDALINRIDMAMG